MGRAAAMRNRQLCSTRPSRIRSAMVPENPVGAGILAAGASNQRIAEELVVSLDTVKKHVSHVLGKLGATNRTEAVARARQLAVLPY